MNKCEGEGERESRREKRGGREEMIGCMGMTITDI
jgi:hypothetical protein